MSPFFGCGHWPRYEFLSWLRDERKNSARTLNLRLAAIKAFLRYCNDEDFELTPTYLSAKTIHAFTEVRKTKAEHLTQKQMELLLSLPDMGLALGRRNRFFMIFTYETGEWKVCCGQNVQKKRNLSEMMPEI